MCSYNIPILRVQLFLAVALYQVRIIEFDVSSPSHSVALTSLSVALKMAWFESLAVFVP